MRSDNGEKESQSAAYASFCPDNIDNCDHNDPVYLADYSVIQNQYADYE